MVDPRIVHLPHNLDFDEVRELEISKRALDLWADCDINLDDWQEYVVLNSLVPGKAGKWASSAVALNISRQNGKGACIEARLAVEVDIVRSGVSIYSAHLYDTSMVGFRRFVDIIEASPRLRNQLKTRKGSRFTGVSRSHGDEGLEFTEGRHVRFRTRSKGGGRGWTSNLLILDEAMVIPEDAMTSMVPTLAGKSMTISPQLWYAGSAVDQEKHEYGVVFARVRKRGLEGTDPSLAYFEWSVEGSNPDLLDPSVLTDRAAWAQSNPALGIRIDPDFVASELQELGARGFAVERLGVGDWPRTDHVATNPLDWDAWYALRDPGGVIQVPQVVVYDVSPERRAAVVVAGVRKDGLVQGELVESKGGTAWVAERVSAIAKKQRIPVVCDGRGPASSLVPEFRDLGIEVEMLTSTEHGQACGHLMDAVARQGFRHLDDPELNVAVRAAVTRPLGDSWAWSRKDSSTNIAPLVAFTLAISSALTREKPRTPSVAWA